MKLCEIVHFIKDGTKVRIDTLSPDDENVKITLDFGIIGEDADFSAFNEKFVKDIYYECDCLVITIERRNIWKVWW